MQTQELPGADPWAWITGTFMAAGSTLAAITAEQPWWVPVACSLIGALIPALNYRAKAADRRQDERIARLESDLARERARADELARIVGNGKHDAKG